MNIDRLHRTLRLLRAEEIVDFDLSDLVIGDLRIFQMGSIPRSQMPQLKGFPRVGSVASRLPADKNGKVSVSDEFANYMAAVRGLSPVYGRKKASQLRGSQSELVASKVAHTVQKLWRNPEHKKFHQTYYVSHDGILLDGHHGWAAVRIHDLLQDTCNDTELVVARFDLDINELVKAAREFTEAIGLYNKEGV